jgi:hypothetical protein
MDINDLKYRVLISILCSSGANRPYLWCNSYLDKNVWSMVIHSITNSKPDNCNIGGFDTVNYEFAFSNIEDATQFKLTWL